MYFSFVKIQALFKYFFWCEVICFATIGALCFWHMTSVVRFFNFTKEEFSMKKARKSLSLILAMVMILSIIVIAPTTASAAVSSRNDGNWFFPLPQNYYKSFTDWAGCNASPGATGACPFHGSSCLIGCKAYHKLSNGMGHNGIDIECTVNTNVYASSNGTIVYAGALSARGNTIIMEHKIANTNYSYYSIYQHLASFVKSSGSANAGDLIAKSGNSGGNYGYHLHFSIIRGESGLGTNCFKYDSYGSSARWLTGNGEVGQIVTNPKPGNTNLSSVNKHAGSVTYVFFANQATFWGKPAEPKPPVIPTGTRTLSDGEYHIVSAVNNSYGLSVANGSLNNYANVLIYDSMEDTDTKSLVTVKYLGDGTYSLTFKNSGKVLNVEGGSKASGANVIQYDNDGTKAGKWIIKETGDGHTFYIISSLSGMYLDLNAGKATSGNNIQVYNGNSTDAQKWSFIASGLSTGQTVSDGEYHIVSSTDNSYGLDVHGGNTSDGTNIQLYKNSTDSTQTFNVKYLGSGYYEIQSTKSKKNIDLSKGYSYSRTNVHIWSPNIYNSSKLILKPTGDCYYIISKNAGLTLDIYNGTIANGTNIWGFVNNGSNAQRWKFVKVPKVDRTSKVHINYDTNGGEMRSTNIGNKVISQINGSRSENEMVIYDSDFYGVNTPTNCYGMELGFDKDGKRVSYRKYEDQTPSAIRYGGFVASEHRGSLIGSIVDRINFGYCDYSGKKVYFYENQVSYNYEVKDLSKDKTYGSMPTPTREGYRFDGWYTAINGGTKVTSTTEIGSVNLYAHWSKSDNTSETEPTPATEEKIDISKWQVSGIYNKQYTGKYIKQYGITVYNDGEYADIKVKYKNNLNAGTATVIITGIGDYTGTITKTFKINKAKNPMLTWRDTEAVFAKTLKKHKVIVKGVIGAYDYQGSVTFTKFSGSKSLTISKGGVITVKKGKYKKNSILSMKVKITAKGNANYMSKSKKMTVKIKIK